MSDEPEPTRLAIEDEPIDLSDIRAVDYPVLVVFWALAGIVFLQFFTRYVLNDSLGWTEEIARYFLIAVTFIGSIMAVRKRSHIAVEMLYRWMPRRMGRFLHATVDLIALVFYAGLAWLTGELAGRTHQMMTSIDVPKAWLYWGIAVCFALMAVSAARVLVRGLMGRIESHPPLRGTEGM